MAYVSFDFHNAFSQVEVVGTDGWLLLPGTGFRRKPFTKLLVHRGGGKVHGDRAEPAAGVFPHVDTCRLEVEHFADAIRGRSPLEFTPADTRATTALLEAMHASIAGSVRCPVVGVPRYAGASLEGGYFSPVRQCRAAVGMLVLGPLAIACPEAPQCQTADTGVMSCGADRRAARRRGSGDR